MHSVQQLPDNAARDGVMVMALAVLVPDLSDDEREALQEAWLAYKQTTPSETRCVIQS